MFPWQKKKSRSEIIHGWLYLQPFKQFGPLYWLAREASISADGLELVEHEIMSMVLVRGLNISSDVIERFAETILNSHISPQVSSAVLLLSKHRCRVPFHGHHFMPLIYVRLLGLGGIFTAWTLKIAFFRSLVDTEIGSKRKKQELRTLGMDSRTIRTYKWKIKLLESSPMKCWALFQLLTKILLKNLVSLTSLFLLGWSSLYFAKAAYEVAVVEFHKARGVQLMSALPGLCACSKFVQICWDYKLARRNWRNSLSYNIPVPFLFQQKL